MEPRDTKEFPVSWDELHRHARALAWRLLDAGPFTGIVAVTRGGLVPASIVARELSAPANPSIRTSRPASDNASSSSPWI